MILQWKRKDLPYCEAEEAVQQMASRVREVSSRALDKAAVYHRGISSGHNIIWPNRDTAPQADHPSPDFTTQRQIHNKMLIKRATEEVRSRAYNANTACLRGSVEYRRQSIYQGVS
jgi:hypothetical protein